jgi:hypothetical protein
MEGRRPRVSDRSVGLVHQLGLPARQLQEVSSEPHCRDVLLGGVGPNSLLPLSRILSLLAPILARLGEGCDRVLCLVNITPNNLVVMTCGIKAQPSLSTHWIVALYDVRGLFTSLILFLKPLLFQYVVLLRASLQEASCVCVCVNSGHQTL